MKEHRTKVSNLIDPQTRTKLYKLRDQLAAAGKKVKD